VSAVTLNPGENAFRWALSEWLSEHGDSQAALEAVSEDFGTQFWVNRAREFGIERPRTAAQIKAADRKLARAAEESKARMTVLARSVGFETA